MRIAVTGKTGQVVTALLALNAPDLTVIALGRPELDLAVPSSVRDALKAAAPDVVVSSAAYTAVDKAESESDAAFAVNRDGARAVAEAAAELSIPVIHLSTDYVFDGSKTEPYVEDDATGPTSVYGRSKLEGELAVAAATDNHAILRTAWVYSPYGNNFVKTMLRLAETRDELRVVADQVGCPTSANDIAKTVVTIARRMVADPSPALRGVFHLAGSGETSWAGFARAIFAVREAVTGTPIVVHDITTADYPTPAKRPANSRLNCDRLEAAYGLRLPRWQTSTEDVVKTLLRGTSA